MDYEKYFTQKPRQTVGKDGLILSKGLLIQRSLMNEQM